jgi:hypothetical protein
MEHQHSVFGRRWDQTAGGVLCPARWHFGFFVPPFDYGQFSVIRRDLLEKHPNNCEISGTRRKIATVQIDPAA